MWFNMPPLEMTFGLLLEGAMNVVLRLIEGKVWLQLLEILRNLSLCEAIIGTISTDGVLYQKLTILARDIGVPPGSTTRSTPLLIVGVNILCEGMIRYLPLHSTLSDEESLVFVILLWHGWFDSFVILTSLGAAI